MTATHPGINGATAAPIGAFLGGRRDEPETFIVRYYPELDLVEDELPADAMPETAEALDHKPAVPLAVEPPAPADRRRKWLMALAASIAFHVAVAGFFLWTRADLAMIEGGENAGIALLGESAENLSAAGDISEEDVTNVSLITMLRAETIEAVDEAAEVAPEAITPVEAPPERLAAVAPEAVQAVRPETVAPDEPQRVEAVPDTETSAPAPMQRSAAELTADTLTPSEDPGTALRPVEPDDVAPVAAERLAPVEVDETPPEEAEQAKLVETTATQATPVETVVEALPDAPEVAMPEEAPRPEPRPQPVEVAETRTVERRQETPKRTEKPAETKKQARQERRQEQKAAGNAGRSDRDARRGVADGRADGNRATNNASGRGAREGNAAVSNYPGKVQARVNRARRNVSRNLIRQARSDTLVAFTVTASGGLGSVRIARSSGSSALDNAALDVVRRAAPFPPIPAGAGRSSWQFSIPMGFAR